jgi:hypothetical protein
MGNEAVMVCRSCPVLTTERFSDRRRTHNPEWVLCCASAWVAGNVKAIKATPTRQACSLGREPINLAGQSPLDGAAIGSMPAVRSVLAVPTNFFTWSFGYVSRWPTNLLT